MTWASRVRSVISRKVCLSGAGDWAGLPSEVGWAVVSMTTEGDAKRLNETRDWPGRSVFR